ncbi:MAG: T9SS type A sorting domain-containing protein, partial [Candidatus Kapaibacteriota bacterium]
DIKDITLRKFPNISFQNYVSTPKPINKLVLFSQGKFLQSIELTENIQIYELAIWDILGRKVFTQNYPEPNSTIYLQGITDGVYFLRLSTNEGYKNFKILVK